LLSDVVTILLLLAGLATVVLSFFQIKWIKRILAVMIAGVALIAMFPAAAFLAFLIFESMPELLDRLFPLVGKSEIIELDKFRTFSGKEGDRYYFSVLMKSPPKDMDKLKARMVQYFYEKTQYINTVDSGSYVSSVYFYKYARRTAYFINHDEYCRFFSSHCLDNYPDTRIGYIFSREPCKDDSKKYEDVMYMYEEGGSYRETAEGLYSECRTTLKTSPKDVSSNPDSIAMVFVEGVPTKYSDFYISKYEVTQGLWKAVMGKNPSDTFSIGDGVQVRYGIGDNYPVYNISWNDAQDFIVALNAKTGKAYRMPTEAEWRYAARGGNRSKGYEYSGSNNADAVAWYTENNRERPGTKGALTYGTKPVGTKQANELGIHDMSGNVREFVSDWHTRDAHLSLGGSWYHADDICATFYMPITSWDSGGSGMGVRLARDPF